MSAWNAFDNALSHEASKPWRRFGSVDSYDQHIVPIDDDQDHELHAACECKPTWIKIDDRDTLTFYVEYTHQAYDGRPQPEK